jgi:hypothetical protein
VEQLSGKSLLMTKSEGQDNPLSVPGVADLSHQPHKATAVMR